jgi:hypothetical protein
MDIDSVGIVLYSVSWLVVMIGWVYFALLGHKWTVEVPADKTMSCGPYRTSKPDGTSYVTVSLHEYLRLVAQQPVNRIQHFVMMGFDKALQGCRTVWESGVARQIGRYGTFASLSIFMFWGTAYLFGETPASVTALRLCGAELPLGEFSVSRLWDAPFLFIAFALVMVSANFATVVIARRGFSENEQDLMLPIALIYGAGTGLCGVNIGYLFLVQVVLILSLFIMPVLFIFLDCELAVRRFQLDGKRNPFANNDSYTCAILTLVYYLVAGTSIGLLAWGLPIGLAVGVAGGLVAALLVGSVAYVLTFVLRVFMLLPRLLSWMTASDDVDQ